MSNYTVKQLARLSGVSVRTLHHYDEIGLLKPSFVGENRYRYYGREQLLRLQDILFHRELGVPLQDIGKLLELQGSDRVAILREHREWLAERVERSRQLLATIDRTMAELNGDGAMEDKELYKGFSPEKQAEYEDWMVEQYGGAMKAKLEESRARFNALSKKEQQDALAEGGRAEMALVECFRSGLAPNAEEAMPLVKNHRAWISRMWGQPGTALAYAGLANLYANHPVFRERYEAYADGFTDWLASAMKHYAAGEAAA
jgi:DNA-binding transcriptional MerR regulator